MHGGAAGSGALKGNRNAVKQGLYTREAIEDRRRLRDVMAKSGRKTWRRSQVVGVRVRATQAKGRGIGITT